MSATFDDRRVPFVLAAAVLGVSMSGPLVRLSNANPLAIASWRLAFQGNVHELPAADYALIARAVASA